MDSITITILCSLGTLTLGALAFVTARIKDAEKRGELLNRVSQLEAERETIKTDTKETALLTMRADGLEKKQEEFAGVILEHGNRLAAHDLALSEHARDGEYLAKLVEKVDKKLDTVLERMSECRIGSEKKERDIRAEVV